LAFLTTCPKLKMRMRKVRAHWWKAFLLLAAVGMLEPGATWCAETGEAVPAPAATKTVVVIDPGHGGEDTGLKLTGAGPAEKEFTLKVSQELKNLLGRDPLMTVWLTRSKDQSVSLNARQSLANAKNTQVFVSLHASDAGGAHPQVFIFTHHVIQDETLKTLAGQAQDSDLNAVPWDQAQAPVKPQSRALAKALEQAWEAAHDASSSVVQVQEIPLGGLMGVKAPAVLVEVPLPVALGAKAYEAQCRQAAKILAAGIRGFLERR
jgi:N-acetylmuramoyl-L-alanine amidase